MIRRTPINLNYCNTGKKNLILGFLSRYTDAVNQYIDLFWELERFSDTWADKKLIDSLDLLMTYNAKANAAQQALHIIKSQRKKKKKTKPVFKGNSFEFDHRLFSVVKNKKSKNVSDSTRLK